MQPQLFKFKNTHGHAVKGVLYGEPSREVGVVYLPGIVLGSTAVHRIGVELAQQLAGRGHPVGLFDPAGVGESEGDYPAGTHHEVARWVEDGRFLDDTLQAIEFLSHRTRIARWLLVGHCGGALTGLYAAAKHPAVCGTLMICPPTIEARTTHELDREGVAAVYMREYARKLTSPRAWLRLLGGSSSYKTIWRVARTQLRRRLRRVRPAPAEAAAPARAFNPRLLHAMQAALAGGKQVSIVFGDRDPAFDDFTAFRRQHVPDGVAVRIVEDASHGFVTEDSMERLFDEVRRVLETLDRPTA